MLHHTLTMAPNGRIVIPAPVRAALGLAEGGKVVARLIDGAIVLEPIDTAIRRAQAMVRAYIPAGSGLVDELIADRHAAAEHE